MKIRSLLKSLKQELSSSVGINIFTDIPFLCAKKHATELYQLEDEFLAKFMEEMVIVSKAVATAFECDKMNYECLGNGDTHLHWHLFPRVKGDLGEYGNDGKGPVWWLPQEIMWNKDNIPNEKELKKMKAKLLKELEKYV